MPSIGYTAPPAYPGGQTAGTVARARSREYWLPDYSGAYDATRLGDVTVTSGSQTITSASARWTTADIGKIAVLSGNVQNVGTITGVNSPTSITVSFTPSYSGTANAVLWYGTDNNSALQSIKAASGTRGASVWLDGLALTSGSLDLSDKVQFSFIGNAGQSGPTDNLGGLTTSGVRPDPLAGLIYTGSGSYFINATDSLGIRAAHCGIQYANGSFTGDLVMATGTTGTTNLQFSEWDTVTFGGVRLGGLAANSCLNLSGTVFADIENCVFARANYGLIGIDPNAASKGITAGFSNAVNVRGAGTEFGALNTAWVLNPGSSWCFYGVTFEPNTGAGAQIVGHTLSQNVLFSGCGFWDNLSTSAGIVVKGHRWTFDSCYFEYAGNSSVVVDASQATVGSLAVTNCDFDGYSNPTGVVAVKGPASGSGNTLGLWLKNNTYRNGITDPTTTLTGLGTVTFVS